MKACCGAADRWNYLVSQEKKVAPHLVIKLVLRARDAYISAVTPLSDSREITMRRGGKKREAQKHRAQNLKLWISICSRRVRVCVRARCCVCVSVCYVILSGPQLLSHTEQACWGAQPTGPLCPVCVFLGSSLSPTPPPPLCFPRIEFAQYGFLISAGLLCKRRTHCTLLRSAVTHWQQCFPSLRGALAIGVNEFWCLRRVCVGR